MELTNNVIMQLEAGTLERCLFGYLEGNILMSVKADETSVIISILPMERVGEFGCLVWNGGNHLMKTE